MNLHVASTAVAAVLAAPIVASAHSAENYAVDVSHASVIFSISHLGYSFTYGRFNRFAGTVVFDRQNPAASQFAFQVDASSIDTNDAKRDEHLRNADFFNVKQFPQITFQSTSAEVTEKGLNVTGNLTMHGVTKSIVLPVRMLGEGRGPAGKTRKGMHSQFQIKRSDFGMTNMLGPIGDEVAITISFEGVLN